MAAAARLSVWKSIALGACHYLVTCRRPQQLTAWLTFGGLDSLPRHLAFDGYGSLPLGSARDGLGSLPIGTALSDHGVSPQGMASTALTARPLAQGSLTSGPSVTVLRVALSGAGRAISAAALAGFSTDVPMGGLPPPSTLCAAQLTLRARASKSWASQSICDQMAADFDCWTGRAICDCCRW